MYLDNLYIKNRNKRKEGYRSILNLAMHTCTCMTNRLVDDNCLLFRRLMLFQFLYLRQQETEPISKSVQLRLNFILHIYLLFARFSKPNSSRSNYQHILILFTELSVHQVKIISIQVHCVVFAMFQVKTPLSLHCVCSNWHISLITL